MSTESIGAIAKSTSATQLRVDQAKLALDTRQKSSAAVLKADQAKVAKDQQAIAQAGSSGSQQGAAANHVVDTYL